MVLSIDYSAGINLNSHCHHHSKKWKKEFYSLLFASLLPVTECRRHLQGSCLMPVLLKLFFFSGLPLLHILQLVQNAASLPVLSA